MLRLLVIGGTALAALVTVTAAPADNSRLSARATVDVVGAGSLAWPHVAVRTRPSHAAPMVKSLGQFIAGYRPRTVLALHELRDPTGKPTWYRVSVPGRPNGRTGWIPAASVSLQPVDRWLVIFRGARRFEFVLRGRVVRSGPVAIGAPGMPTPLGLFYVQVAYTAGRRSDPRRLGVRDKRLLAAVGLARRRHRRRARNEHTTVDRPGQSHTGACA